MLSALVQVLPLQDCVILCHHSVPARAGPWWHRGGGSPECHHWPLVSVSLSTLSPALFTPAWRYHCKFPSITAPTHFCSTAEHFSFCCASSWVQKGFFPGCVLQHFDKGHTKYNTRNRRYWACKSNASWQNQLTCFHCTYKFCCLIFCLFHTDRGYLCMLEFFAVQHCRSRGWYTSVSIGTSALALLQIYWAGSHGWCWTHSHE